MISKVSFPRLIIPLVSPIAAGLDCLIAMLALVVLTVGFGAHLSWTVIFAPLVVIAVGFFGYAIALWLAPLNAVYRDVGILMPFVIQIAMYLSPIVYPATLVPEKIRWIYELNPVAVMVELDALGGSWNQCALARRNLCVCSGHGGAVLEWNANFPAHGG